MGHQGFGIDPARGWLAIAGVPPFSGFWSKDEILLFTLVDSPVLYVIGLVTAVLTAFYMTRQVIMVFFGDAKWESHANADEAPEGDDTRQDEGHIALALTRADVQGQISELGANIPSRVSQEALDAFLTFTPPANNQAFLSFLEAEDLRPRAGKGVSV